MVEISLKPFLGRMFFVCVHECICTCVRACVRMHTCMCVRVCVFVHLSVVIVSLQKISLIEASNCATTWLRGDKQPMTISLHRPGHIGGWLTQMGHKKFEVSTSIHVLENLNCLILANTSSNMEGSCKYTVCTEGKYHYIIQMNKEHSNDQKNYPYSST